MINLDARVRQPVVHLNSTTNPAKLQLIFDQGESLNADDGRPVLLRGHRAFVRR